MHIERRVSLFELRDISVTASRAIIEGYWDVWGVLNEHFNERSMPGGYKKTLKEGGRKVPINRNHDPGKHIGYAVDGREDDYGLLMRQEINLDVADGREQLSLINQSIEVGNPMGISREFIAIKDRVSKVDGVRELVEQRLVGGAFTPYQSLAPARISDVVGLRDILAVFREVGVPIQPEQEALVLERWTQAAWSGNAEKALAEQAADDEPDWAAIGAALRAQTLDYRALGRAIKSLN